MTQEQLPPTDAATPEPAMELLDGDATSAPQAGPSLLAKIARGTMYSVVLLAASALLAISAVPELAEYASFVPEPDRPSCGAMASGGHCTTLDNVSFDTPCCAAKAAMAAAEKSSGCCPFSGAGGDGAETVLASAESASGYCSESGEASLVAASDTPPCCDAAKAVVADEETPIDAGSLLAAKTSDEAADQQSDDEGTVLEPDQDEVEE